VSIRQQASGHVTQAGLAIKKPTQKNPPKKPTKNVFFFLFFGFFFKLLIFYENTVMQTFLFETDFL
jgi:hypothetical protein